MDTCRTCGHPRAIHLHYTRSTHCSAEHPAYGPLSGVRCSCERFRPRRWWHRH